MLNLRIEKKIQLKQRLMCDNYATPMPLKSFGHYASWLQNRSDSDFNIV